MYTMFLFSDIHGHYTEFKDALKKNGFQENNKNHILISLGDLFDRGNESKEIFEFLLKMKKEQRFYGIRGNHDDMLLEFMTNINSKTNTDYWNFRRNGLKQTLESLKESYVPNHEVEDISFRIKLADRLKNKYPELVSFLKELKDEIEVKTLDNKIYNLTHAGFISWNIFLQIEGTYNYYPTHEYLLSERDENEWIPFNWMDESNIVRFIQVYSRKGDGRVYVFGHWHAFDLNARLNIKDYVPKDNNKFEVLNLLGIDTATALTKKVNIIVLKTNELPNLIR